MAVRLGELLVEADTVDKQLKAMGHRLVELDDDCPTEGCADGPSVPTYAPYGKTYVAGPRPGSGGQPVFQHQARRQMY